MKRCLIVDDSKVIRMVARKIIQELGFDTDEASDGFEALKSCEESMPQAVLLDWKMPTMDGLEFLKYLRAMPDGGQPVVIYCTTMEEVEHLEEAIAFGASDTLLKPFDAEIITQKFAALGLLD